MAVKTLDIDTTSLDFGSDPVLTDTDLTFTLTNNSSPSAAISGTVGTPSSPFSVVSNGGAFTLNNNGDTRIVTVRFNSEFRGSFSDSVDISHDATNTSPIVVALTGIAYTQLTPYALPEMKTLAGILKPTLYIDRSLDTLLIPEKLTFTHISELFERIDNTPGLIEFDNVEIDALDAYDDYTEGFWYHVFQTDPTKPTQLRLLLEENGTDKFLLFGTVDRPSIKFSEWYVSASDPTRRVRDVTFRVVSNANLLKTINVQDVMDETVLHLFSVNSSPGHTAQIVTLQRFVASVIRATFEQSWDYTDCIVRNNDMRFTARTYNVFDDDVALAAGEAYGFLAEIDDVLYGYWDTANDYAWYNKFESAFELMNSLLAQFLFVGRYYYGKEDGSYDASDERNNRHRFELVTRGRSFTDEITPIGSPIEQDIVPQSPFKTQSVRASMYRPNNLAQDLRTWKFNGVEGINIDPPPFAKFDIDMAVQFSARPGFGPIGGDFSFLIYKFDSTDLLGETSQVGYWNYETLAWVDWDVFSTLGDPFLMSIVEYYYERFNVENRKMIETTYSEMRAESGGDISNAYFSPFRRLTINDGLGDDTYYINSVKKNLVLDTASIQWLQE